MRYLLSNEQYDALKFLAGAGKRRLVSTDHHGRRYWFLEGPSPGGQIDGRSARGMFTRGLVAPVRDLMGEHPTRNKITERGRRLFALEHCLRVVEPGGLVSDEEAA